MSNKILSILEKAKVEVSPEIFAVISLPENVWFKLLENPDLSPRMTAPFLLFKDKWEVTLVFDEIDFGKIADSIENARIERNFRLLSFDVELPFEIVGFMAQIAKIFADAGISILPFSSFSRDHVLIRQDDLARALKSLRGFVGEIC